MKFRDVIVNREDRFCIGIEEDSGKFYVSIPVANSLVDYSEYYEISEQDFERFKVDTGAAASFVSKCRQREMDSLLFLQPGRERGFPV